MILRLRQLLTRPIQLWILLWVVISLLYLPAWKGGFQQDFHGWLQMFYDLTFWDAINRKFAGINSFYQLTQLQLYLWTTLFGTHQWPWYFLFTGLHALNGVLLFRLANRILYDFNIKGSIWIALCGAFLFLINPSMTEVVMWKACYHYHIALLIVLCTLIWVHKYLKTGVIKWVRYSLCLFVFSTLTLEIWYSIPWLTLLLIIAYQRADKLQPAAFRKSLLYLFTPMVCIFCCYLFLYHYKYGSWIAHSAYRSKGDDSFSILVGRIWSYQFHLLTFGRFFPNNVRNWFYQNISGSTLGWIIALIIILGYGVYAYIRFPKAGNLFRIAALFAGWTVIAMILILHFIPEELHTVSNDRYLYFMAAFEYMLIAVVIGGLLRNKKRLWIIVTLSIVILNLAFTARLVWQWRQSNKIFWGIQQNYKWEHAPLVLILNLPATYKGVGIILSHDPSDFTEHMRIFFKRPAKNNVYDVSSYNMINPWDGAHVTVLDSMNLKVTLNQWGTWWWKGGLGATDYENDLYSVHFTDPGHEYLLTLKKRIPGTVIIYQQGMQWRVVDMNNTSSEQW